MDLELKDKVILVSGGAKGIGAAIVRAIAQEGGIAVATGRSPEVGKNLVEEIESKGCRSAFIQAELASANTCKQIIDKTLAEFGRLDGLVNNAGVNDGVGLENGSPEAFMASVSTNLGHYYYLAHYALPELKKNRGSIVNISSKTAITGQGGTSGYAASKGAQLALSREWAVELLPYGVRVNAIIPSEVMTPQYADWIKTFSDPDAQMGLITDRIPLDKRMTTSEEIASATVFLLSNRSSHTTGQWWYIDGGYVHLDRAIK